MLTLRTPNRNGPRPGIAPLLPEMVRSSIRGAACMTFFRYRAPNGRVSALGTRVTPRSVHKWNAPRSDCSREGHLAAESPRLPHQATASTQDRSRNRHEGAANGYTPEIMHAVPTRSGRTAASQLFLRPSEQARRVLGRLPRHGHAAWRLSMARARSINMQAAADSIDTAVQVGGVSGLPRHVGEMDSVAVAVSHLLFGSAGAVHAGAWERVSRFANYR